MYEVPDVCLKVAASSQTLAHQTLVRVLEERQVSASTNWRWR
jgi:hypothetical protein